MHGQGSGSDWRLGAARVVWYAYGAAYLLAALLGAAGPLVIPLLAGIPLVAAAVLFALLRIPRDVEASVLAILAAVAQTLLGLALVGPAFDGAPEPLRVIAWALGLALPIALTAFQLRRLRAAGRAAAPAPSAG